MKISVLVFLAATVGLLIVAGCSSPSEQNKVLDTPSELISQIKIGMDRSSVERLLGSPNIGNFTVGGAIWYLPGPTLRMNESPFAPGCIGIVYSKKGRVLAKRLNSQYRE
jgi:hypothetical protein